MAWGPALPLICILLKLHRDAIYKILPRGFRTMRDAIDDHEVQAERRHGESKKEMRSLKKEIHKLRRLRRKERKKQLAESAYAMNAKHGPHAKLKA
jgi:Na+/phosphate symporter